MRRVASPRALQLRRHRWCAPALGLALAIALAGPLGLAEPAGAASSPCQNTNVTLMLDVAITILQPAPGVPDAQARQCTPNAGSTLTGSWTINIQAASVDSLSSFSVAIVPASAGIPALGPGASVSRTYQPLGNLLGGGNGSLSDTIQLPWNTAGLTPYNGTYKITATATSLLGDQANASVGGLIVNNPPTPPTGLAAALAGSTPVVAWAGNPEPDITGYQVLRSSGGAYSAVGTTADHSFEDTSAPQGASLTYEVVAIRSSPVTKAGIPSGPSAPSNPVTPGAAAVAPVNLPPPPSLQPPPKPKPIKVGTAGDNGALSAPAVDNTFAPTLPFTQAIPTETVPGFSAGNQQTLASDRGQAGTTTAQKLRFLATAIFLLLVAFFIIRLARKVLRGQ